MNKFNKSKDSTVLIVIGWIIVVLMCIGMMVMTAYGVTGIWIWEIWGG